MNLPTQCEKVKGERQLQNKLLQSLKGRLGQGLLSKRRKNIQRICKYTSRFVCSWGKTWSQV